MIRIQQTGTQPKIGSTITGTLADRGSCHPGPEIMAHVDLEIDIAPYPNSTGPYEILLGLSNLDGDSISLGPPTNCDNPENRQLHLTTNAARLLVEQLSALLMIAELGQEYVKACQP